MLKGISPLLSPELLFHLASMGHGDELVLADANFPVATCAQRMIRCDGHDVCALLEALLPLFPLDTGLTGYAAVMATGTGTTPPVWVEFSLRLAPHGGDSDLVLQEVERQAFYDRAKKAYCVIATGERALFGNLILRKGVVA